MMYVATIYLHRRILWEESRGGHYLLYKYVCACVCMHDRILSQRRLKSPFLGFSCAIFRESGNIDEWQRV